MLRHQQQEGIYEPTVVALLTFPVNGHLVSFVWSGRLFYQKNHLVLGSGVSVSVVNVSFFFCTFCWIRSQKHRCQHNVDAVFVNLFTFDYACFTQVITWGLLVTSQTICHCCPLFLSTEPCLLSTQLSSIVST